MGEAVLALIVAVAIFVVAHMQGQKAGARKAKVEAAKEIAEVKKGQAESEYKAESDMSPDQLVDAMLKWLRSREAGSGGGAGEAEE